jgi:hypothetical protein
VVNEVVVTKRGGQPGNKNALKTGRYTADKRALRRQMAKLVKRAHVAMAEVEKRLPRRKPGPKGGARIPSQGGKIVGRQALPLDGSPESAKS